MTDAPDTSAKAVDRLARTHDAPSYHPDHSLNVTAATLRAQAARIAALEAEVARLRGSDLAAAATSLRDLANQNTDSAREWEAAIGRVDDALAALEKEHD